MSDSGTMPGTDFLDTTALMPFVLPISQKVVLVIDVVESVRLMAVDEAGAVARWHGFASQAQAHTIPTHQGRLVKSLGDGLMVEFDEPRDAVGAALSLHASAAQMNRLLPPDRQMHLRAGINATHVYTDHNDIFGAGVNLAARLATLAGPGETVVSASVRDGLTDGLDAAVEDLGECYLKHIDEPVRAYRVGAAGAAPVVVAQREYSTPMQPTIAVIPFDSRANAPEEFAIGDILADRVISQLSHARELKVISKSSTAALRGRDSLVHAALTHLDAAYVVSGSYLAKGNALHVWAELTECKTGLVAWSDSFNSRADDLFAVDSEISSWLAGEVHSAILASEANKSVYQPMPTLKSYTLLIGAVAMIQRQTRSEFVRGRELLEYLIQRHGRSVHPRAWLANWHILNVVQGWSANPADDGANAHQILAKCLDAAPQDSFALALTGLTHAYLLKNLDEAANFYDKARAANPNEPLAWLCTSTLLSYRGEGKEANMAARKALALTPLDPLRYFYNSLAATAVLSSGDYEGAIDLANKSLRANRNHTSTYRTLAIAQALHGQEQDARQTVQTLLKLEPALTVTSFMERYPGRDASHAKDYAHALRSAGLPN
jgi:adenylate cyclase